jgi:pteridine reductase
MSFTGRTALVTGAAKRIGRLLAEQLAARGANILLHYGSSKSEAEELAEGLRQHGVQVWPLQADLAVPQQVSDLFVRACRLSPPDILINNASIFAPLELADTRLEDWQTHLDVNLTAPFLLSQAFAAALPTGRPGRILNLLDWRAMRPGADHFPYTISKAGLAALTRSLAIALAPRITVNGLAFGAILPPSDGGDTSKVLEDVPAGRWAQAEEVWQAAEFLLDGPQYVTGEILHLDGGRHLI